MPTRIFGLPGLPDLLRLVKYSYGDVLVPTIFILFFLLGLSAVHYKKQARTGFIIFIICGLIVTSQLGVTFVPFVHAQRYSDIDPQEDQVSHAVLFDSKGDEIRIDGRAISPHSGGSVSSYMLNEWGEETQISVAAQVIDDSQSYRDEIRSPVPRLKHPPSSAGTIWTQNMIEQYDTFEGLRIYEISWTYESDSHNIKKLNETCVLEITPQNETVSEVCSNV